MGYQKIRVPADGDKITVNADLSLNVPNRPIIPFIEGDGIGVDITPVMLKVTNEAVAKAYGDKRSITWDANRSSFLTKGNGDSFGACRNQRGARGCLGRVHRARLRALMTRVISGNSMMRWLKWLNRHRETL